MPTGYRHGYTYDLFVSYSSREAEWVRVFQNDLVTDINHFAELDVFAFFDQARIQPGYVWNEQMLAAAGDSALFVPVLTPRFFQSEPCQKELKAFVGPNGVTSDSTHRSRVLPVKLLCSAPSDHPLALVQALSFCTEVDDAIPFEHQPGTREYKDALRKLAWAVAQVLKTVPPRQQRRAAVYLASDFKPPSAKLRASLQHNFDVLPEDPRELLELTPEQFRQSLENDFAQSFVSVHPLGDVGFAKPLIEAQLEFARGQTKPRLVWTCDRPDELTNSGFEWFTSQAEIEDRIRRLHDSPPDFKSSGTDRLIYFLCPDRANKAKAEPLLEILERRGVHTYPSPLEGAADEALRTHVSALSELDGCLIYYGDVQREWFDAVFLSVQKKIRQRGLLSAIFLAPPSTPQKSEDLRRVGLPVVEEPEATATLFLGRLS